ncbi:MAG TPA: class I SAM-dependent methyltransferase, partial [Bryobacteraceae bacterium]|nr:class I SAM-dependent methyltransferase [Bryobacteraceae bacterium]
MLVTHLRPSTRWLDLGCGHQIAPWWILQERPDFLKSVKLAVGCDRHELSLRGHASFHRRVLCDITRTGFRSQTFNLVTLNMVAEHLPDPAAAFREIARLLEPGGLAIIHTPNRKNYQSRIARLMPQRTKNALLRALNEIPAEDVFPTFYRVNTEKRLRAEAARAGLEVVELRMVNTTTKLKVIPLLAVFEFAWVRLLETEALRSQRADIIAVLRKREL